MRFGQDRVAWQSSIIFVGTVLDANGNDGSAILYRTTQASKVFHKWKPVLLHRSASLACRIELACRTVFATLLWLAETWCPTQKQRRTLSSWGARTIGKIVGVRRHSDEDAIEYWRRLHRVGHSVLQAKHGSVDVLRRGRFHRFAGHLARDPDSPAGIALRTRSLSWWRHFQGSRLLLHPGNFKAWRWESPLEDYYGSFATPFVDVSVGWMAHAQHRETWRQKEHAFARSS